MTSLLHKLDALVRMLRGSADKEWARLAAEEVQREATRIGELKAQVERLQETGAADRQIAEDAVVAYNRLRPQVHSLTALHAWLGHQQWRCDYPRRYPECSCGLDDACDAAGVPRVPRQDNDHLIDAVRERHHEQG